MSWRRARLLSIWASALECKLRREQEDLLAFSKDDPNVAIATGQTDVRYTLPTTVFYVSIEGTRDVKTRISLSTRDKQSSKPVRRQLTQNPCTPTVVYRSHQNRN